VIWPIFCFGNAVRDTSERTDQTASLHDVKK
jgi:hypothetical protein